MYKADVTNSSATYSKNPARRPHNTFRSAGDGCGGGGGSRGGGGGGVDERAGTIDAAIAR